jgi:hypothetical protein
MMFTDNDVDYAALTSSPLDACRPFASAAEPKAFFRGTALTRHVDESIVDDDAFL